MSRKVYRYIVWAAVVVLVASFGLTMAAIYRQYSQEFASTLRSEAESVEEVIDLNGLDALEVYKTAHRITVVKPDGTVLYDNTVEPSKLDNHKNREEIAEAFQKGSGSSIRTSDTLSRKTVNEAVLMKDGMVLRVSGTQTSLLRMLEKTALPLAAIGLVAVLLLLLAANKLSHSIVDPINQIDLEHPDAAKVYAELEPLVDRIGTQNHQIAQQMQEQKRQHDAQDQMRRDFTANVSHELKTPLTSISGYAELIECGIAKEEDVPRFAGKIHEESQRLITLVGDIIKLSQLDGNDVMVKSEDIDVYETCASVLSQLEHAASKRGVRLSLSGEHCYIYGAMQVMEEIVFNLCDNAVKYNRTGGLVSVSVGETETGIELVVRDTGIGIPKEEIPRIFERFYRVDKSHSKEIGGTGLGLSIVKHGARYMGAKTFVESEPGKGTTIRVLFPKNGNGPERKDKTDDGNKSM